MKDALLWCVVLLLIACLTAGLVYFSGVGPKADTQVPAVYRGRPVRAWLDDAGSIDPTLRTDAFKALSEMGPANRDAVPELTQGLQSNIFLVQAAAARALGRIGPNAKDAIPALEEAARGAGLAVLREIIEARKRIEGRADRVL
jgi:HEAT repeat protein